MAFLSIEEVATLAGVTRQAVYYAVDKGRLARGDAGISDDDAAVYAAEQKKKRLTRLKRIARRIRRDTASLERAKILP